MAAPPINITGAYTLTFVADPACQRLPETLRTPTYRATIAPAYLSFEGDSTAVLDRSESTISIAFGGAIEYCVLKNKADDPRNFCNSTRRSSGRDASLRCIG
jgi:hypothetical protein